MEGLTDLTGVLIHEIVAVLHYEILEDAMRMPECPDIYFATERPAAARRSPEPGRYLRPDGRLGEC